MDLDVVGCMPGIRLLVGVYARVRVPRTSSLSRTFKESAHLLAFLLASFSNAYENNILQLFAEGEVNIVD